MPPPPPPKSGLKIGLAETESVLPNMVPPGFVLFAARLANVGSEFLSKIVVVAKFAGVGVGVVVVV